MADFESLSIKIKGDASHFARAANKASMSASSLGSKMDVLKKSFSDTSEFEKSGSSMEELAVNMTDLKRVGAATVLSMPALVAGIGAIVPAATSAGQAVMSLGTAVGAGAAGFVLFGGAAGAAAAGGLKAYTAAVTSSVTASREAYLATNEKVEKQLEEQKQTILNTRASTKFNEAVNRLTLAQARLQAEVGKRVFPAFTRWIGYLEQKTPQLQKPFLGMISDVTMLADVFVKAQMQGEKFRNIIGIMNSVRDITMKATSTILHLASAGLNIAPMILAPATRLTEKVKELTYRFRLFTESKEGVKTLGMVFGYMESQMNKLGSVLSNLVIGMVQVGAAMGWAKEGSSLLTGLDSLMKKFVAVTAEGSKGAAVLSQMGAQSQPIIAALGTLLGTVAREAGLLMKNLMGAKDSATGLNPIIPVLQGITESIRPLRQLVQETFVDLAPELAKLIPNLALLAENFAGSTGTLVHFLGHINKLLSAFNGLPGPVKGLAAEFVALNLVMSMMTGTSIVGMIGGIGRLIFNMRLLSATNQIAGRTSLVAAASQKIATAATYASAAAAKVATVATYAWAAASRVAAIGARLLGIAMTFALGPWGLLVAGIVIGAVVIYKNWDRIKKAGQALLRGLIAVWRVIKTAVVNYATQTATNTVNRFKLLGKGISTAVKMAGNLVRAAMNLIKQNTIGNATAAWKGGVKAFENLRAGIGKAIEAARKFVVNTVSRMVKGALGLWENMRKGAASRFDAIRNGVTSRIDTTRKNVVKFVGNMKDGALKLFEGMKNGAHDRFDSIRNGITERIDQTRKNVLNLVDRLRGGVANLWDKMMSGARGFGEGFYNTVKNWFGKAVNSIRKWLGAAALGLANLLGKLGVGPEDELRNVGNNLQSPIEFARGGVYNADKGGVAGPGRMGLVGEAGQKEAIVNLEQRTPESQKAMQAALRSPNAPKKGSEARPIDFKRAHRHRGPNGPDQHRAPRHSGRAHRKPGSQDAYGSTMPISVLIPEMQEIAKKVKASHNVSANTYSNHPPGYSQPFHRERSVDFWGPGGRGDPIGGNWEAVANQARSLAGDAVNWVLHPGNDAAHSGSQAHVHMTAFAGSGKGKGTSGSTGPNVMELWSNFTSALGSFPSGGLLDLFSGMGGKVLGWAKDFVWEQAKKVIGSIFGGSSPGGLTLGEAVSKGGFGDNKTAVGVAWEESGANASARNPSGARGLFQIMPETAKGLGVSYSKLDDPIYNASAAHKLHSQRGWQPWVAYPPSTASMSKGGVKVTGYKRGGIVPGLPGMPKHLMAHAGERILPQDVTRSFDRLANSITIWQRSGARNPGIGDARRDTEAFKRMERTLEAQLHKMSSTDELQSAFVNGAFAAQMSSLAAEILDEHLDAAMERIEQMIGR